MSRSAALPPDTPCQLCGHRKDAHRYRFQVSPVNGSGSMWVEDSRLIGLADLLEVR